MRAASRQPPPHSPETRNQSRNLRIAFLTFRHLLERHSLGSRIFELINEHLVSEGCWGVQALLATWTESTSKVVRGYGRYAIINHPPAT